MVAQRRLVLAGVAVQQQRDAWVIATGGDELSARDTLVGIGVNPPEDVLGTQKTKAVSLDTRYRA